ncbi:hypothetical protein B0F90DRAFT_1622573 [Multifurca ochricompacta]|uniref:Protein EFR3 n=1 Tax=Multifurca ochricompacta TaxID=376703 RepID=A0AAD4MCT6_9AGAM|nr:hypothetical protein B0F90DRAFT_1622573 [Multifurca ochricompacta]
MRLFLTPNHVQLITACYPPSASLLTSGPDYHPNAQELSRLTYYAANRPGKINKLSNELEKRTKMECRKAHSNNPRSRASLLISLSIFKALATECRRDLSLLTPSLLASVNAVLSAFPSDIEVSAKAANLASLAWTTFTDGRLIGVDQAVTDDYLSALERFSKMSRATSSSGDLEFTNRTRLVGLAALTGVVTSEALYSSSTFKVQVSALVPAIMNNLQQVELSVLKNESANLRQKPLSPYLDEFRTRPVVDRRAASIHLHVDGERGPTRTDVSNACLRAFSYLFDHSSGGQITFVMQAAMASLDEIKGWEKVDHCSWFAGKATEWTQYQFRDAIPTRLIERLLREQDVPTTTALHFSLAAMITTVFTSPIPLVMSTSDVISNLITLVLRRAAIDPTDSLILALTECIGALGTHVYYADQIHDLASELISRLVSTEATGLPGRERDPNDRSRSQALRALIAGLVGLMRTPMRRVEHHSSGETPRSGEEIFTSSQKLKDLENASNGDKQTRVSVERADGEAHLTKRTKISPETWQDTLNLIYDVDFSVRSDYANALLVYLESEISTCGEYTDEDGVRRSRPLVASQIQQADNMMAVLYGDETTRFLHAAHVYLFILATSPTLHNPAPPPSSARSTVHEESTAITVIPATPGASHEFVGGTEDRSSPTRSQHGRPSLSLPSRIRKQSLVKRMISRLPSRITSASPPLATASDYRNIASVLAKIHEHLPVRGLLTGVPFLITLSSVVRVDDSVDDGSLRRACAIREVISRIWLVIGRIWDCRELVEMAEKALSSMSVPSCLPREEARVPGQLSDPEVPIQISSINNADGIRSGVDPEMALAALATSKSAHEATGMDSEALHKRLSTQWTAESAFKDSMEPQSSYDPLRRDGISPHWRLSPALMHIENLSLQSLARSARGVGVTDLRDALEGRSSMSNPALVNKAPSISTLDHASTHVDASANRLRPVRSRPEKAKATGNPSEVRDMLSKLHIGKSSNGNLLRASFPGLQRQGARLV